MSTSLPRPIWRSFSVWIAALACLGGAACFRSMNPAKIKCVDESSCPTGYSCIMDNDAYGHCEPGVVPTDSGSAERPRATGGAAGTTSVDAARGDGAAGAGQGGTSGSRDGAQTDGRGGVGSGGSQGDGGGTTGSGGIISPDAPTGTGGALPGSGGTISQPDAPMDTPMDTPMDAAGLATGSPCTSDGQCSSPRCIDGVCCATACTGCNACSNALTGDVDGKCAPVASGKIAHQACTDETATKPCGNDGTCDGKGACRKVGTGQKCGQASCSADGTTFSPEPKCDGNGACSPADSQTCTPYPCAVTGCAKTCAKQGDCNAGMYCNTTLGTCATQKANGTPATQTYECTSGIVADGVCCDKDCTGCSACTADLNGQATSTTGRCLPVIAAKTPPATHAQCTPAPPCGLDGACDGNGSCRYPAFGADCGTPSCDLTTSMLTKSTCNISHTCAAGGATPCPGSMACLATGTGCKTGACAGNADCASGTYCLAGGTCGKKPQGDACGATAECSNGLYCADGVCCNATCAELCKACNLTTSRGTCTRLASGQPVHGTACTSDNSACGGSCNGSSDTACYYPAAGQSCGAAASCSSDLTTLNASACNGGGSCGAANQGCSSLGQYCDSSTKSCVAKKTSGSCSLPIQCSSSACCSSSCVSLGTNTNCSACGDACASPKTCQSSQCLCGPGYTACGTGCCNTSTQYCSGTSCLAKKTVGSCTSSQECVNYCTGSYCCTTSSCSAGQTCSSGTCQSTCQGGLYICSSCLAWNFETGTTQSWTAKTDNCTVGVSTGTGLGSYSLAVNANSVDGSTIEVTVPLCTNGASIAIPTAGYTFTGQVKFQSYSDFGDGSQAAILIEGEGYYYVVYSAGPISPGQWVPLSGPISQRTPTNASSLTLRFFPYAAWSGVIYIDNVAINSN